MVDVKSHKAHVLPLLARKISDNLNPLLVAIANPVDLRKQIFSAGQIAAALCKILSKAENGLLL